MEVIYYEACILTRVGVGHGVTMDDFHKSAWALFSTANDQNLGQRPFLFRFDSYAGNRSLLTIRSDRKFPGAAQRQLSVSEGCSVEFDLNWIPVRRRGNKPYTPPESEWPDLVLRLCERAGIETTELPVIEVVCTMPFDARMQQRSQNLPIANCRVRGRVSDVDAFAQSYLDGLGRKKGYGMGMIRVTLASELTSRRVA